MEALTFMVNWAAVIALAQFIGSVLLVLGVGGLLFYAFAIFLPFFFGKD